MKRLIVSVFCCFLTIGLLGCFEKKTQSKETPLITPNQPARVLDYLDLSASFLINQQQNDGFFKYEYDFITGNYTGWDNIIHQTRAGFSLTQYYLFLVNSGINPQMASIVQTAIQKSLKGYESVSIQHNSMPGALISFYYNKTGNFTGDPVRKSSNEYRVQRLEAEIAATAFALATELNYWGLTNSDEFQEIRNEWRSALLYHARQALLTPMEKRPFMAPIWLSLSIYNQMDPTDKNVASVLDMMDDYFTKSPRPMKDVEDYSWDMMAVRQRSQTKASSLFTAFAARQTSQILETLYTQHDTNLNSCMLSLGLAEASILMSNNDSADITRIQQTALGRGQLEYYSSLKFTILPHQTWISLGPGRTLHSQDFKRFSGASIYGLHTPRTNIGLIQMCLLAGMRFANEDIKELKQK